MKEFIEDELARLELFRELARDLHPYVIRYNNFKFRLRVGSGVVGDLIPEEPFHRMISFVRQAYMDGDDTHFRTMLRTIGHGRPELHERLGEIRNQWNGSLKASSMVFRTAGETYSTMEVFAHNLHARYAHRKVDAVSTPV